MASMRAIRVCIAQILTSAEVAKQYVEGEYIVSSCKLIYIEKLTPSAFAARAFSSAVPLNLKPRSINFLV